MSLRTRLTLLVSGAVIVTVTLVAGAAFASAVREVREEADAVLRSRASDLGAADYPIGRQTDGNDRRFFNRSDPVQFLNSEGTPFAIGGLDDPLPVGSLDLAALEDQTISPIHTVSTKQGDFRVITVPLSDGAIMLARDLSEQEAVLDGLRVRFTTIGLLGAIVAGMIGWLVVNRALAPVNELARTAEHVAATQDLTASIRVDRDDELGRLAVSFNTMLAALGASRQQQRRLIDDASHELRTPLTALRTNIDFLTRASELPTEERQEILADATFELEELTSLVSELVELATDTEATEEPRLNVALDELVARVAERAERRWGRPINLRAEPVLVEGRPNLLERAVSNLLDNAAKFSDHGSPIEVLVEAGNVRVTDHGVGIPDHEKSRVFDRFYRASEARTLPGSGLGLSIVKQVAEAHGGTVFVEDADGGGSVVGFTIPVQDDRTVS